MKKYFFFLVVITIINTGCETQRTAKTASYGNADSFGWTDKNESFNEVENEIPDETRRLITYDATLNLTIKIEADSAIQHLFLIAEKFQGYVSSSSNYSTTMEIKSQFLDSAIVDISLLGELTSKSIYGNDVTNQYYDLNIRLENAQSARKRYLELLAQAENVTAALLVEKELERLNREIDLYEGEMKGLQQQVQYSSVTVYLQEKVKPGVLGYIGIGIYESIKWLFVRG